MDFLTSINLTQNELQNVIVQNLAASPTNPKKGQIYYNTTDNTLYQYKGEENGWVSLDESKVFIAIYDTTTIAEIESAYQAGKAVFCRDGLWTMPLSMRYSDTSFSFSAAYGTSTRTVVCTNISWTRTTTRINYVETRDITLTASDWVADGDGFKQDVAISGFLYTSNYLYSVYPEPSNFTTWCSAGIYADNVTSVSHMTFRCISKPSIDISAIVRKDSKA